jgi:ABC-type transport system involved in cytochrome c biogenesis permease subunit
MDMISPQHAAPAPTVRPGRLRGLMQRWWQGRSPVQKRRTVLLALLAACAVALNVGVVLLGVRLFAGGPAPVAPSPERRIAVPYASESAVWDRLRRWTVQEDGRLKPYDTFCRESVRAVTGRERFEDNDPVAVVTSWLLLSEPGGGTAPAGTLNADWEHYPFILCDHHELRAIVYRDYHGDEARLTPEERRGKYVEPAALRASDRFRELARAAGQAGGAGGSPVASPLEKKAEEVGKRLALYDRIRQGGQDGRQQVHVAGEFGVVALDRHGPTWFSLRGVQEYARNPALWDEALRVRRVAEPSAYAGSAPQPLPLDEVLRLNNAVANWRDAYRSGDAQRFAASADEFLALTAEVNGEFRPAAPRDHGTELWFNGANPFRKAWLCGLSACVLLACGLALARWRWPGRVAYWVGMKGYLCCLGWAAAGFWCRVSLSGRPPVSNMYESLVWVAFMSAAFGLVLELVYRRRVIALAGALVSTLGFVLADQLPLTFSPNIQPLQAVLRSNYWLVIHVLTIVSSYAAFALAWGLGNLNLGLMLLAPGRTDLVRTLSGFCYRAIQVGVVLLAAGTLLGGFWAAESWGRFWGWDPKEVWALIALVCYLIPLHARYAGWVKDFGLAFCSVVCFASVVMAWYGVNFVLGVGLHSYGFGGGNDLWVYWCGLVNLSMAVHAALRYHGRRAAWE